MGRYGECSNVDNKKWMQNIGENELLFDIAHAENSPHVNVVQIFTNVLDNKLFWNFERAIA